jgi:hypothetical protein
MTVDTESSLMHFSMWVLFWKLNWGLWDLHKDSRQRIGKYVLSATNPRTTAEPLDAVFSVRSVLYPIIGSGNQITNMHIKIFVKTIKQRRRKRLILGLAYLMPDCWLEVRKVLRTANKIKVSRGFSWPQSKCLVGAQTTRCTAWVIRSPPNGNTRNFALM